MIYLAIIIIIIAYLIGSIPVGYIVSKAISGRDVRTGGSGATGATNVARQLGMKYSVVVSVFDIAKGAVPVLLAGALAPDVMWLRGVTAIAAIIGHCFPVWIGFRGGKGINTAFGAAIVIAPLSAVIALAVFAVVFVITRFVSVGSLAAVVAFAVLALGPKMDAGGLDVKIFAVAMPIIVFFTHRKNIVRLVRGEELKPTKQPDAGK